MTECWYALHVSDNEVNWKMHGMIEDRNWSVAPYCSADTGFSEDLSLPSKANIESNVPKDDIMA